MGKSRLSQFRSSRYVLRRVSLEEGWPSEGICFRGVVQVTASSSWSEGSADGAPVLPGDTGPVRPPASLLFAALAAVLLSAALVPTDRYSDLNHVSGWLLASIVGIGLIAAFTAADTRRRQSPRYSPRPSLPPLRATIAVLCVVVCSIHAWQLAWSVASR